MTSSWGIGFSTRAKLSIIFLPGSESAAATQRSDILLTISFGVAAGAASASQPDTVKASSSKPCSLEVGTSGSARARTFDGAAMPRTSPFTISAFIACGLPMAAWS